MSKKHIALLIGSAAAIAGLAVASVAVFADTMPSAGSAPMMLQVNRSGHAQLAGSLVSASGTTLTVASWGGNWTVDASSAKLIRRFGGASNVSEFQTGDALMVTGTVSQSAAWTIAARVVRDNSIQVRNASFSGTISNLGANSFSFDTRNRGVIQVSTDSNTKFYVNGKAGTFSDLANGMTGTISGVWDRNQSTVHAMVVRVRTPLRHRGSEGHNASSTEEGNH